MNTHDPIEQLFSDKLGESFQPSGSTTWEELQAKRKSNRSLGWFSSHRKTVLIISILAAGTAAAIFSGVHNFAPKTENIQPNITQSNKPNIQQTTHIVSDSLAQTTAPETTNKIDASSTKPNTANRPKTINSHYSHIDTTTEIDQIPLNSSAVTKLSDSSKTHSTNDSLQLSIKPVKTIVVVHKQAVVVKDTSLKRVTKHVRRRF